MFSAEDPRPVVNWLCQTYGLQEILQAVAEFRPAASEGEAPAKRAYKKRAAKKGGAKKGGAKRGRPAGKKQANAAQSE